LEFASLTWAKRVLELGEMSNPLIFESIAFDKLFFCSADAGPDSQREESGRADKLFKNAPWVGAVRNSASQRGIDLFILTTGHGLVLPSQIIEPYDKPIDEFNFEIAEIWDRTVTKLLENYKNTLMIFYSGGCPRDKYLGLLLPILKKMQISVIAIGKPFMYDVGKLDGFVTSLLEGHSLQQITEIHDLKSRPQFYSHLSEKNGLSSKTGFIGDKTHILAPVFREWVNVISSEKEWDEKNICYSNELHVATGAESGGSGNTLTDGNGIIIDSMRDSRKNALIKHQLDKNGPKEPYRGRTLIENNLVYNNGGRGVHVFRSEKVDVINNTCYGNQRR
jgi:parallel beta-helix repeat protein